MCFIYTKNLYTLLTSDFNLMTKELKNMDILRKDFVTNVSHEFKTPITSIKGFAKLIRYGKFREQATVFSLDEQIRKTILILEVQWSKKEIEFNIYP